jgi:hypothetical protein
LIDSTLRQARRRPPRDSPIHPETCMTRALDDRSPLSFKVRNGHARSPVLAGGAGRDVFRVDTWQLPGHQREAIVSAGAAGDAWRVTSDEGLHLKGTDLAPFPFGYFNAGLQGDLMHRLRDGAAAAGIALQALELGVNSEYALTGSFALGNACALAAPAQIEIRLRTGAGDDAVSSLVRDALAASPALAILRSPVPCRFALYVNGCRVVPGALAHTPTADAVDPDLACPVGPRPLAGGGGEDAVRKTAVKEDGTPTVAPPGSTTRMVRYVTGSGRLLDAAGRTEVEAWLQYPGSSHFIFRGDEGAGAGAPSGLALLSAGMAFCYMTQLSRTIEHLPSMAPFRHGRGARVVQTASFAIARGAQNRFTGACDSIDTHVFLNADAPAALHVELATHAARGCFLRAAAAAALAPVPRVMHNGRLIA